MPTPSLDGSAQGIPSGVISFTTNGLTTSGAGRIFLAIVNEKTGPITVSGITGAGLSWGQAVGPSGGCQVIQTACGGTDVNLELWTAVTSGALTSQTFTVSLSAATDDTSYYIFGLKDLYSVSSPFDPSGGPYTAHDAVNVGNITWSTTRGHDLVMWFGGGRDAHAGNAGVTNLTGGGGVTEVTNTGGALFSQLDIQTGAYTTPQSSTTSAPASGYRGVGMIVVFTGDGPALALQTFVTCF